MPGRVWPLELPMKVREDLTITKKALLLLLLGPSPS